jgi:MinD-like ATPase involved in chromosome partitioning or flagellar assembly
VLLAFWSPKGGSGTSVVAAATALALAGDRRTRVRVADLAGDLPAILGLPPEPSRGLASWLAAGPQAPTEALDATALDVVPGLKILPLGAAGAAALSVPPEAGAALGTALRDHGEAVLDAGLAAAHPACRAAVEVADASVVVVRSCYLALRRAVRCDLVAAAAGVALVDEPGRALGEDDVSELLGLPILARFPVRTSVARAVDAGVLACGLPAPLARPAEQLIRSLMRCRAGRAA